MSPKIFAIANLSLPLVFNDFHTILVFTVNWDCSKLLLICRDFESNLGPRLVDKNPVFFCFFCVIYSAKTNRVFQQIMAPSCSETDCPVRYYQICYQTRHAKSFGNNLKEMTSTRHWYCRNCCPTSTSYSSTYTCFCYCQILQPSNQPHQTIKSFNHQTNPIFNYPGRLE